MIASPSGAYFTGGIKPVSVWLSEDYTRAAPGGTGAAKCGGNYAAAFVAQAQAVREGCDQVVWLDAKEHRWVEEMGGMNLFFGFYIGMATNVIESMGIFRFSGETPKKIENGFIFVVALVAALLAYALVR